jgi:hypothetical protein
MEQKTVSYFLFLPVIAGFFCCTKKNTYQFSTVQTQQVSNFDTAYKAYCQAEFITNFELNAVQGSFYGDYHTALDQATKRASIAENEGVQLEGMDKTQLLEKLRAALHDPQASEEYKTSVRKFIELLTAPSAEQAFAEAKPVPAVNYIVEKAGDFHFTLINEAHYNSQHRAFTRELLKPLWEEGYRYLALETLYHTDTSLHTRGYPTLQTGYYTKDANFGNLVRDALRIGYQLVPYETQNRHDGTLRDRDQANNIYQQTWQKDQKGKVLIHAAYGHISEFGSSAYEPMGYQLKN